MFYFGEPDMSIYDTARLLKTPGVTADVYISPSTISKRTKLGAQRMLRDGLYQGTWSSRTRRLAALVRDTAKYPPFMTSRRLRPGGSSAWYGGTVAFYNYNVPIEVATELVALMRADLAVYKINHPEETPERYGYLGGQLNYLKKWDATKTISAFDSRLTFWQDDFAMQMIDLVKATRTPAQIEQANALAAMLDSTERIYITNYHGE
jgi:hypothetical protein